MVNPVPLPTALCVRGSHRHSRYKPGDLRRRAPVSNREIRAPTLSAVGVVEGNRPDRRRRDAPRRHGSEAAIPPASISGPSTSPATNAAPLTRPRVQVCPAAVRRIAVWSLPGGPSSHRFRSAMPRATVLVPTAADRG